MQASELKHWVLEVYKTRICLSWTSHPRKQPESWTATWKMTYSPTWLSGSQKHRYIKCENFVPMVAKTLLKPAFSPPSLHKTAKICSDGIWHDRPDLAPDLTCILGIRPDIQTWQHDLYRTWHQTWHQLGAWLSIRLESRQGEEIRHRRVTQCTDLQVFTQDACLPRHAGIWTKSLAYKHLQNTLNGVLQQKSSPGTRSHVSGFVQNQQIWDGTWHRTWHQTSHADQTQACYAIYWAAGCYARCMPSQPCRHLN